MKKKETGSTYLLSRLDIERDSMDDRRELRSVRDDEILDGDLENEKGQSCFEGGKEGRMNEPRSLQTKKASRQEESSRGLSWEPR